MSDNDTQACLTDAITFTCPECALLCTAGYEPDDTFVVLHAEPACKMFNSMDGTNFLYAVAQRIPTNDGT